MRPPEPPDKSLPYTITAYISNTHAYTHMPKAYIDIDPPTFPLIFYDCQSYSRQNS